MAVLDTTIVNVALDTLSRDLGAPLSTIQWVSTGYLLSLAAVIPLSRLGHRALRLQANLDRLDRAGGMLVPVGFTLWIFVVNVPLAVVVTRRPSQLHRAD
jgi:MFS family permease